MAASASRILLLARRAWGRVGRGRVRADLGEQESRGSCADWTAAPRSCCSAGTSATRRHPAPRQCHRRPPALDHPLPRRPVPATPRAGRSARARAGWPRTAATLQRIHGERHHLQQRSIAAGGVQLSDAIAHWVVLDDDNSPAGAKPRFGPRPVTPPPCTATSFYDILPQTRGGYGRLQDFGIRFGYERVVLHLQPQVQAGRLECNTARTLLLDHEPLPWARWGEDSPPRCPTRSTSSRNAPPAPSASPAEKRSATASAR